MSSPPLGLAGGSRIALAARLRTAWDDFLTVAEGADLGRRSRLPGWRGYEVCVHLGSWPGDDSVEAIVASARDGGTGPLPKADDANARRIAAHPDADRDEVLAALRRARDAAAAFLDSPAAEEVGMLPATSSVGRLPVLTMINATAYELAVHALDLRPCGAPTPSPALLDAGLAALIDVTGALAAEHGIDATVTGQTPAGGWSFRSVPGEGWTTAQVPAGRVAGTAVLADAAILLDVSAGRAAVPPLLLSRALRVQDMPSFLRLAPLVDAAPGIPGSGALSAAARTVSGMGGLVRRLRRPKP